MDIKNMASERTVKLAVKGLLIFGLIAVAAPAILLFFKGLLALIASVLVVAAAIFFGPPVGDWMAVKGLKLIKGIASKNPILTLQRLYMQQERDLGKFREGIEKFLGQVELFRNKSAQFAISYPKEASKFESQLLSMEHLLALRQSKYKEAQARLAKFHDEIKKASAIWDMTQASAELTRAAGMIPEDPYAKIKAETAVEAVQESLAMSIADLRMAMMDEADGKTSYTGADVHTKKVEALTMDPSHTIVVVNDAPALVGAQTSSSTFRPFR